jgi:membrane protease YdiL (CAAX protease family)
MKLPTRYVLPVFLLIVFLAPVVLAPPLDLALAPFGIPFHRVMSRALLLSALAALVLFRGRLHLKAWWPLGPIARRQLAFGAMLAAGSALAMILLYFAGCGFHAAPLAPGRAALSLLTAAVAALIVPFLEETIFRGFLVSILVETTGRRVGWILAAVIYTLAHFLRMPSQAPDSSIHFWSGATGLLALFSDLGHGSFLNGRGLNLFLVGLILGGIFLRTGTLWVNYALHGGWIFILMSFSALTRPSTTPRISFFGGDLLSSPLTSAVLLLLGLGLWRFQRASPHGETPS